MQTTLTEIIQAELSHRLEAYKDLIESGALTRAQANAAYIALQTALWMAGGCEKPAMVSTNEEAREVIRDWIRTINREATATTLRADCMKVRLLEEFLEKTKPEAPPHKQYSLI